MVVQAEPQRVFGSVVNDPIWVTVWFRLFSTLRRPRNVHLLHADCHFQAGSSGRGRGHGELSEDTFNPQNDSHLVVRPQGAAKATVELEVWTSTGSGRSLCQKQSETIDSTIPLEAASAPWR